MSDRRKIETLVKRVIGKVDTDVVSTIDRALSHAYDRRKLKDRLSEYISDRSKLSKLTDKVFDELTGHSESRKRPKFEENPNENSAQNGQSKRAKTESTSSSSITNNSGNIQVKAAEELKVKELMTQAQRTIEERRRKLNLPNTQVQSATLQSSYTSKLAPAEAQQYMQQALDKAKRATDLKSKIAARMPAVLSVMKQEDMDVGGPSPLILDSAGQTIDIDGKAISLVQRQPTLKANVRAEKRDIFLQAQLESEQPAISGFQDQTSSFSDPRVSLKSTQRQRRQFSFHEKGQFEQLANKQRAMAKLDKLQSEISQASKKTGISSAVKLAMVAPKQSELLETEVPNIEWWDTIVLPDKSKYVCTLYNNQYPLYLHCNLFSALQNRAADCSYDDIKDDGNIETFDLATSTWINNLVEHPIQLRPPDEPTQPQYLKVYLTKKERKKLRRQSRKEMQREKTEKIRLGLEPPPEPKMKISNLMRVLGTEAIQDPTKMEAHVREQMAKRLKKHEEVNLARKLTPEQRAAKKAKKLQDDTSLGVQVAVYRVTDLSHPSKKFKVEMNAKQLAMTGVVVLHKEFNVVVVEGGSKQHKFFKRLMLHRIKWEEDLISSKREEGQTNKCVLIWEGLVRKRNFGEVRFKACPLAKQARELFEKHGVAHYWDLSYAGTILEQEEDSNL